MKLLDFAYSDDVPEAARGAVMGHRWIFEIGLGGVYFWQQYRSVHDGGWHYGVSYYGISLTRHWALGRAHLYYDGPHDSFSLGFLHVNWAGDWCDKCFEDR